MANSSTFYERYCLLCDMCGVTNNAVVSEIGLSRSVAVRWKRGSLPTGSSLIELSKYFGVSTDALLGLKPLEDEINAMQRQKRIAEIEAELQDHDKLQAELEELKSKTHKEGNE